MICDDTNRRAIDHQHPTDGRWFPSQSATVLRGHIMAYRGSEMAVIIVWTNGLFSLDRDNTTTSFNNIIRLLCQLEQLVHVIHIINDFSLCPDNNNLTDQNFLLLDLECWNKMQHFDAQQFSDLPRHRRQDQNVNNVDKIKISNGYLHLLVDLVNYFNSRNILNQMIYSV